MLCRDDGRQSFRVLKDPDDQNNGGPENAMQFLGSANHFRTTGGLRQSATEENG